MMQSSILGRSTAHLVEHLCWQSVLAQGKQLALFKSNVFCKRIREDAHLTLVAALSGGNGFSELSVVIRNSLH